MCLGLIPFFLAYLLRFVRFYLCKNRLEIRRTRPIHSKIPAAGDVYESRPEEMISPTDPADSGRRIQSTHNMGLYR